jgi:uncharacterized protein
MVPVERPYLAPGAPLNGMQTPTRWAALLWLALTLLAGCRQFPGTAPAAAVAPTALVPLATPTLIPVEPHGPALLPATATRPPTATPLPTVTLAPAVTPTPDPYAAYSIGALASRQYGGGMLEVESTLATYDLFTRKVITYPSDGLLVYGFLNEPVGEGPFPVALVLHGYVDPKVYNIVTYTARYADALARAGYLVIHPNYRNFPPSDRESSFNGGREKDFRVGYAVDVLNLMAIVRQQAGQPGPLARADGGAIHLLGHSMGGGITLRVLTIDPQVRSAVLYGAMSGEERRNYEKILQWSNGETGAEVLAMADVDLERISPIYHLDRITVPVAIHHGALDDVVPPAWSAELCQLLRSLQKPVECYSYPDQPHTFYGDGDLLFQQRVLNFFNQH